MNNSDACPCGNPLAYVDCCGRYHAGEAAPSAEALMRSRYTAYVKQDAEYLLLTWHPTTRPDAVDFAGPSTRWLGLQIKQCWQDGDDRAGVEFVARFRVGGEPARRLHEKSRFALEEGRWYYLDDALAELK